MSERNDANDRWRRLRRFGLWHAAMAEKRSMYSYGDAKVRIVAQWRHHSAASKGKKPRQLGLSACGPFEGPHGPVRAAQARCPIGQIRVGCRIDLPTLARVRVVEAEFVSRRDGPQREHGGKRDDGAEGSDRMDDDVRGRRAGVI